jgi:hypothetical protein
MMRAGSITFWSPSLCGCEHVWENDSDVEHPFGDKNTFVFE